MLDLTVAVKAYCRQRVVGVMVLYTAGNHSALNLSSDSLPHSLREPLVTLVQLIAGLPRPVDQYSLTSPPRLRTTQAKS